MSLSTQLAAVAVSGAAVAAVATNL